jgi:hypothetical protein
MKTIAQQLNIKTFPFIIKDSDGEEIYREYSNGYWAKREWTDGQVIYREDSDGFWAKYEFSDGKVIRWENSNGVIKDYRPKTDVQKAIDLLTKEGLIVDGKILKN